MHVGYEGGGCEAVFSMRIMQQYTKSVSERSGLTNGLLYVLYLEIFFVHHKLCTDGFDEHPYWGIINSLYGDNGGDRN